MVSWPGGDGPIHIAPASSACLGLVPVLAVPLLGSEDWVGVCVGLKYFYMASQNSKNKSTGSARRARSDSPDLTSTKKQCTLEIRETTPVDPDHWPRFLVLHATDEEKPLTSLSPFAIAKGIQGLAGVAKQIKPMPSGDLLVEVTKRAHCENLLRSTTLVNVKIRVTPHRTLNTSRGVIYCPNLKVCEDTELEEELKAQGVGHIRCITRRTPDAIVKTGSYILTFNTPHLPEYILAGYLNIRVNCFIPNPLRCFNCQKFGHGAQRNHCSRAYQNLPL